MDKLESKRQKINETSSGSPGIHLQEKSFLQARRKTEQEIALKKRDKKGKSKR